jgi:hypothetical protein
MVRINEAIGFSDQLELIYTHISQLDNAHRQALITIIILCYLGENPQFKWSEISSRIPSILESTYGETALQLLEAYSTQSTDFLKKAQMSPNMKYLDSEVLKIVKNLPVPNGGGRIEAEFNALQDEIEEEGYC